MKRIQYSKLYLLTTILNFLLVVLAQSQGWVTLNTICGNLAVVLAVGGIIWLVVERYE